MAPKAKRSASPKRAASPKRSASPARAKSPSKPSAPGEAVVNAIGAIFRKFDTNGDGSLDLEELSFLLKSLDQNVPAEEVTKVYAAFNKSSAGKIQLMEFVEWIFSDGPAQSALQEGSASAIFAYGTLRGDHGPTGDGWGVVEKFCAQWEIANLRGFCLYEDGDCFYPFAVHTGDSNDVIVGTLLQFSDEEMARKAIDRCNQIEGYNAAEPSAGLYRRTLVEVDVPAHSSRALAFVYHQPLPDCRDYLWIGFRQLMSNHVMHVAFATQPLGLKYDQKTVTTLGDVNDEAEIEPGWTIVALNFEDVSKMRPADVCSRMSWHSNNLPEASEKPRKHVQQFMSGDWHKKPRLPVFGFGSNSVKQLHGRLEDTSLRGFPAVVHGQALAFAGPNSTWSYDDDCADGGTATLIPMRSQAALGTLVFLTEAQMKILDGFEGVPYVYDRKRFLADVLLGGSWHSMQVTAYVKQNSDEWYPPSEAYRCAVLRNIRCSFPAVERLLLRDTKGNVRGEWRHPGFANLGLGAFLFEVGVRAKTPWTLPHDIGQVQKRLAGADISLTVRGIAEALESTALPLPEEELETTHGLLSKSSGVNDGVHDHDEAQAEQALGTDVLGYQLSGEATAEACELPDGRHRIFTYGTLMTGFHNHHFLESAELLGSGITASRLQMYARNPRTSCHASVPFVATLGGNAAVETPLVHIRGEIYAVTSAQLEHIDSLEGHPQWYHRRCVFVHLDEAEEAGATASRSPAAPAGRSRSASPAPRPPRSRSASPAPRPALPGHRAHGHRACATPGCEFLATWHETHCCNFCKERKGHGARCDQLWGTASRSFVSAPVACWLYFNEVDRTDSDRLVSVPSGDFRQHVPKVPLTEED